MRLPPWMGPSGGNPDVTRQGSTMAPLELFSGREWLLLEEDLNLSPRQAQVVNSIAHAKSDKQIAQELGVAMGTVRMHMTRLFEKFGVNDRVELLVHAFMTLRRLESRTTTNSRDLVFVSGLAGSAVRPYGHAGAAPADTQGNSRYPKPRSRRD